MQKKKMKNKLKIQNGPKAAAGGKADTRLLEANAIIASFNQGDYAAAERQTKLFCKRYPNVAFGWKIMGTILGKYNRHTEALAMLGKAVALNPYDPDIFKFIGNVHKEMGQLDEARQAYEKALRIKPDFAEAMNNLGVVLHMAGNDVEAISQYEKALAVNPDYAEAHNNMGISLIEQGQLETAVEQYKRALQINCDYFEAYNNLGFALQELGQMEEATAQFEKALEINANYPAASFNLGNACMQQGRHDQAITHFLTALRHDPTSTAIFDVYYIVLNSIAAGQQAIFEACRQFYDQFSNITPHQYNKIHIEKKKSRKIHVGYVSGDFNLAHPLHYFMQGVLQHHDKNLFEISCYTTSPQNDAFTTIVQNQVSHWKSLIGLTDDAAMRLIQSDAVDILVDLSGHTKNNRLLLFARKPAPLQVTWLGFLNTTGLVAMDYIICNRWLVTADDMPYCSEKPWYFDGPSTCFWNEALEKDIPIRRLPALDNGFVTFGSCNNYYKINDSVIQCWISILQNIPDSRLFCKAKVFDNSSIANQFVNRFEAAGIAASRITLEGSTSFIEFLEAQQRIDINLDTFQYNGGTVTCHSLSMGVPVLSIKGKSVISHVGESFLRPLGLDDWIAEDADDYVAKAIAWSTKLEELAVLRQSLRSKFKTVYGDAAAFTKRLEEAYTSMWTSWCDRMAHENASTTPARSTDR